MKLVVGGAQFGAPYGIANATGAPVPETVCRILCLARDSGVGWIDTARAYPGSEEAIGTALEAIGRWPVKLATKLLPLRLTHEGSGRDASKLADLVRSSLTESRRSLKRHRLDAVLLHRWEDYRLEGSLVADIMHSELEAGGISAFGVSVQSPEELLQALSEDCVRHIQLPVNILDHRWDRALPEVQRIRKQRPLTIHGRSSLLQGLFLSDKPDHWHRAHVANGGNVRSWLLSEVRAGRRRNNRSAPGKQRLLEVGDTGVPPEQRHFPELVQHRAGGRIDDVIVKAHRQHLVLALGNALQHR